MVLLPWLSYQNIGWNVKKIFFVISEEDATCPECGSPLRRRDKKLRVQKEAGGGRKWFAINRLKCTNDGCRRLHNELPDCMVPYKHYAAEVIEDVLDEVVGPDDPETENYPCEATMKHWKWWLSRNETNVNGQVRSALHRLLDLEDEFLKSSESLLEELRKRISPGWLATAVRIVWNSGGRLEPRPEGPYRAPTFT